MFAADDDRRRAEAVLREDARRLRAGASADQHDVVARPVLDAGGGGAQLGTGNRSSAQACGA